jgi:6-pyruvoyltetrahydropterin/6-carboxytetrahydropterin synthase
LEEGRKNIRTGKTTAFLLHSAAFGKCIDSAAMLFTIIIQWRASRFSPACFGPGSILFSTPHKERVMDVFIRTHFSGGHHLRAYPGNCERPHGHNWKVKVTVRATQLDHLGMGIDFKQLKQAVNAVVDQLDHRDLNDLPDFRDINPSSEHIAMFLFRSLKEPLHTERYGLHSVEVRETDSSGVVYYGD